jgi:anti-sigma regulatory factor (Ser/Thr protein kinase)
MAALATVPGALRPVVADAAGRWQLDDVADAAMLVVSELASNAVRASSTPDGHPLYPNGKIAVLGMRLLADAGTLRIEVWDQAAGEPVLREATLDGEDGRGLALVDMLTGSRWGWSAAGTGIFSKFVWAEIGSGA